MLSFVIVAAQQQAAPAPAVQSAADVVVVGSRRSFRLNTRALRAARSAFLKYRQKYAPNSSLSFVIDSRDGVALPVTRIRLYFTNGTSRIVVPVDADHSFDLARLPTGDWWLESNVSRRAVRVEPVVRSPQSSRYDYRLGDGRVQCRVAFAVLKADLPFLATPLVSAANAAGPCTHRKMGVRAFVPAIISSAILSEDARSVPIEVNNRQRYYHLPVTDQTFSDEARVTINLARD